MIKSCIARASTACAIKRRGVRQIKLSKRAGLIRRGSCQHRLVCANKITSGCRQQLAGIPAPQQFRSLHRPVTVVIKIQRLVCVLQEINLVEKIVLERPVASGCRGWFEIKPQSTTKEIVVSQKLHVGVHYLVIPVIRRGKINADVLKRVVRPRRRAGGINLTRIVIVIIGTAQVDPSAVKMAILQAQIHRAIRRHFNLAVFIEARPNMIVIGRQVEFREAKIKAGRGIIPQLKIRDEGYRAKP